MIMLPLFVMQGFLKGDAVRGLLAADARLPCGCHPPLGSTLHGMDTEPELYSTSARCVELAGLGWSGVEQSGAEWSGVERVDWTGRDGMRG